MNTPHLKFGEYRLGYEPDPNLCQICYQPMQVPGVPLTRWLVIRNGDGDSRTGHPACVQRWSLQRLDRLWWQLEAERISK